MLRQLKNIKKREYFMPRQNDMKSKFQCPQLKFIAYAHSPGRLEACHRNAGPPKLEVPTFWPIDRSGSGPSPEGHATIAHSARPLQLLAHPFL